MQRARAATLKLSAFAPALLSIILACLAMAGGDAAAQNLRKVVVTQSVADSVSFMPIYIARYNHYFEEEGLQVELVITNGGGPDVAALIAGQAQFTAAGPINQVALFQQGQKTLSVASFFDRLIANLVVSKKLAEQKKIMSLSIEDRVRALKGAKISVTRLGALTDMVARAYFRRVGLDPEKDAKIIGTTAGTPQIAALQRGEVDAAAATTPAAEEMENRGIGVIIANNTKGEDPFFAPFTQQTILVKPDWAQQNADTVKAFVRAILKSEKWIREHSAAEGAKIFQSYVPSLDLKLLTDQYALIKDGFPTTGCMTEQGISANIKLFEATGLLKQKIDWTDIASNKYLPSACGS